MCDRCSSAQAAWAVTLAASVWSRMRRGDALRGGFDPRQGIPHRIVAIGITAGDRLHLIDARIAHRLVSRPQSTRDRRDGHPTSAGRQRDRVRQLSVDALAIDTALAGDHQVDADETPLELHRIEHERRTGHQSRVNERDESGTEPSSGAGPRYVSDVSADEGFDDIGVA